MEQLTTIRTFVAVVEARSFSEAARSLGVSRALISRHIANLECQLESRLLNRTTRSLGLTEVGHRYFAFSKDLLAQIEEEHSAILGVREKHEGVLSVISPKWIGGLDLGDAIANFAVNYPKIKVRLILDRVSERTYDLVKDGYDIAFHTRQLRDSSLRVRRIATLRFALCASPDYLARQEKLIKPKNVVRRDCLMHINQPVWHFTKGSRTQHIKVQNVAFSSNTYIVLQKAALQGIGVGVFPLRSVYDDIQSGKLRRLLPEYKIPDRPLYAVYAPGRHTAVKVRCFIDFMVKWFEDHHIPL